MSVGCATSSAMIFRLLYFAPTLRGLSRQSFFWCPMAPQFSQAPFRYFVAALACCVSYQKERYNASVMAKSDEKFWKNTHSIRTTSIPFVDTRITGNRVILYTLMFQSRTFGTIIPWCRRNVLRNVGIYVFPFFIDGCWSSTSLRTRRVHEVDFVTLPRVEKDS